MAIGAESDGGDAEEVTIVEEPMEVEEKAARVPEEPVEKVELHDDESVEVAAKSTEKEFAATFQELQQCSLDDQARLAIQARLQPFIIRAFRHLYFGLSAIYTSAF